MIDPSDISLNRPTPGSEYIKNFQRIGLLNLILVLAKISIYFVVLYGIGTLDDPKKTDYHHHEDIRDCADFIHYKEGFLKDKFVIGVYCGIASCVGFAMMGAILSSISLADKDRRKIRMYCMASFAWHLSSWLASLASFILFISSDVCKFDHFQGRKIYDGDNTGHLINTVIIGAILFCYRPYEWYWMIRGIISKDITGLQQPVRRNSQFVPSSSFMNFEETQDNRKYFNRSKQSKPSVAMLPGYSQGTDSLKRMSFYQPDTTRYLIAANRSGNQSPASDKSLASSGDLISSEERAHLRKMHDTALRQYETKLVHTTGGDSQKKRKPRRMSVASSTKSDDSDDTGRRHSTSHRKSSARKSHHHHHHSVG